MTATDPVIIVGAGPAGLMLACELGLAGVPTVLLEKRSEPDPESRGATLHARSVELLDRRGLMERFGADVPRWPLIHFGLLWLDPSRLGPREYNLLIGQTRTQAMLEERAVELGVEIRRGHAVTAIDQDADAVTVTVMSDAGRYELTGAYLVGCDGEHSVVRSLGGFRAPRTGSTWYGVLGDVGDFDGEMEVAVLPAGVFAALPDGAGTFRLQTVEFDVDAPPDDQPVTVEELDANIQRVVGRSLNIKQPRQLYRYHNGTRHADRYRIGRILLAGDAAHLHFFTAGHGLNTALHDAANLGWKLAATVLGRAPEGLLDSYERERRPVGARCCSSAQAQVAMMQPLSKMGPLRDLLGELVKYDDVNRHLIEMITEIRYPLGGYEEAEDDEAPVMAGHPLLGWPVPPAELTVDGRSVKVAELLHSGRGVLLDLSGNGVLADTAKPWSDVVDVVVAQPVAEIPAAAVLIRPDGFLAWVAPDTTEDGLTEALRTWFGNRLPADLAGA